jgi:hypothetical protein
MSAGARAALLGRKATASELVLLAVPLAVVAGVFLSQRLRAC